MKAFYLGTHIVSWAWTVATMPLMVTVARLPHYKLRRSKVPIFIDGCGFSEITNYGFYRLSANEYAEKCNRACTLLGSVVAVAPQDYMCEIKALRMTGKTIIDHINMTIDNFIILRSTGKAPFIPVIQGYSLSDYVMCINEYYRRGISLDKENLVGIGSICRRQGTEEVKEIIDEISTYNIKMHTFGLKTLGLQKISDRIVSTDSMSWSLAARYNPPLPDCNHRNCANCYTYASLWYDGIKGYINEQ